MKHKIKQKLLTFISNRKAAFLISLSKPETSSETAWASSIWRCSPPVSQAALCRGGRARPLDASDTGGPALLLGGPSWRAAPGLPEAPRPLRPVSAHVSVCVHRWLPSSSHTPEHVHAMHHSSAPAACRAAGVSLSAAGVSPRAAGLSPQNGPPAAPRMPRAPPLRPLCALRAQR